jgi:hypothetical protein
VLRRELTPSSPVRVLEVGAGVGTMIARLVDWNVLCRADYTLLDIDRDSLAAASQWLSTWATSTGRNVRQLQDALQITGGSPAVDISIRSVCAEFREFLDRGPAGESVDLLIANAFLDIVDVPATLPPLFGLLVPMGSTGSRPTSTARRSSYPKTPPTPHSSGCTTAAWTSAFARVGVQGTVGRAGIYSNTCLPRVRGSSDPEAPIGWCTPLMASIRRE